jgi:CheY-like chemotaxis protein
MTKTPANAADRLGHLFADIIAQAPMSSTEKERLTHFAAFVFLSLLIMICYGAYNLANGNLLLSSIMFLCAAGQLFSWLLMCHLPLGRLVYRINGVLFGGLLLYLFLLGGDGGSKSLWLFAFPLVVFFLLGKNEGLAWSAGLLLAVLALLLLPIPGLHPFRYGNEFLARFITIYLFVSVVAYWFEYSREYYRRGMESESARLTKVLDTLPDAISLHDNDGRILLCNRSFLTLTGLDAEQILGKREDEITPWRDGGTVIETVRLPLNGEQDPVHTLFIRRETPVPQPAESIPQCLGHSIPTIGDTHATPMQEKRPFGSTVLLADDDPMILEIGALMLANLGYTVLKAADGIEAVDVFRAREKEIALVLCDLLMPHLDGWQTLARLREITPAIPVIMVSGFAQDPEINPDKSVQPQAYLNKPYTMATLRQAIDQALADGGLAA